MSAACLTEDYSLPARVGEWRFRVRWLPLLLLLCWGPGTVWGERETAKPRSLVGQLQLMSLEQDFEIEGLEQVDPTAPAIEMEQGTVTQQIRSLLARAPTGAPAGRALSRTASHRWGSRSWSAV